MLLIGVTFIVATFFLEHAHARRSPSTEQLQFTRHYLAPPHHDKFVQTLNPTYVTTSKDVSEVLQKVFTSRHKSNQYQFRIVESKFVVVILIQTIAFAYKRKKKHELSIRYDLERLLHFYSEEGNTDPKCFSFSPFHIDYATQYLRDLL